jgi:RimJ/RimL family protein N-acetyltransferase
LLATDAERQAFKQLMIKILILTSEHATSFDQLMKIAMQEYPASFETDFSQIENKSIQKVIEHFGGIEDEAGFRLGAFDDSSELIGTIRVQQRRSPKQSHCADVTAMFVRTENQNQGIAQLLLETTISQARKLKNLEQLELSVSSDAHAALHTYKKVGFEITGTVPRQIKIGNVYHDYLTMWLVLNA